MLQSMSDDIRLRYHPSFFHFVTVIYALLYTLHLFEVIVVFGSP